LRPAPAALLDGGPAADLGHGGVGQLRDVEPVDHQRRVRQRVAHRGFEHGAHVDRDHLDPGPPLASLGADPRRHTRRGAALDLPQQPGTADQVNQPDMPPVGDDFPDLTAVGRLDQAELRLPASGFVDPQVRHRRRVPRQRSLGRGRERGVRHRP
jgi:hypothetical protein